MNSNTHDKKIIICQNEQHVIKLIKELDKDGKIKDWSLYKNNKLISSKIRRAEKLKAWRRVISTILNPSQVSRILIIGGGDQILSNLFLKYPCDITILDPTSFLYTGEGIKDFLNIKDYLNTTKTKDLELRKMVIVDLDLLEAYEDGCWSSESFDLILVDNYEDDLYNYSSIYEKEYANMYKNLLKPQGYLVINHLLQIVDLTTNALDIVNYPHSLIKDIKQTNKIYKSYLASLRSQFKHIEYKVEDNFNKLDIYKNSYVTEL